MAMLNISKNPLKRPTDLPLKNGILEYLQKIRPGSCPQLADWRMEEVKPKRHEA